MSSTERIEPGDSRWLTTTITDRNGAAGDPTELVFTMNAPDGTTTTFIWPSGTGITRDALGVFSVDWPVTQVGTHRYSWESNGTNQSYAESAFIAHERRVVPATP